MCISIYILFLFLLTESSSGKVRITLYGVDIDDLQKDNTLKIIEGNHLLLDCVYDTINATVTWQRNNTVITRDNKLDLERIRVEDEGNYTCTISFTDNSTDKIAKDRKTIFVKLLYSPSYPVAEVPPSFLYKESVSLTYNFEAEPEPTYRWERADGLLLSRNRTYRLSVPVQSLRIYCYLHSFMIPTYGEPRNVFVRESMYINVHRKAYINSVHPDKYIHKREGEDLLLICYADGTPSPKIWWTKTGDEKFYWLSGRYSVYNITVSSAGEYACHVENTVVPANRTPMVIHRTEVVHVWINGIKENNPKPKSNCTNCSALCVIDSVTQSITPTGSTTAFSTSSLKNDSETFNMKNCSAELNSDYFRQAGMQNDRILIISTILGWIVSLLMIALNIYTCKYKNKKPKYAQESQENISANNHTPNQNSDIESSYVTNVRFTDGIYTDLTTYDQIISANGSCIPRGRDSLLDSNDSESVSTQTSVITYIEPRSIQSE